MQTDKASRPQSHRYGQETQDAWTTDKGLIPPGTAGSLSLVLAWAPLAPEYRGQGREVQLEAALRA